MHTTCPTIIDRVYGNVDRPVILCPTCGAVVPVTGVLPEGITALPAHGDRVPVIPAMTPAELDATLAEILGAA